MTTMRAIVFIPLLALSILSLDTRAEPAEAKADHSQDCTAIANFTTATRADLIVMEVSGHDGGDTAAQFDKAYPAILKRAEFSTDLRAALKEYVIAVKAYIDGRRAAQKMQIDHAKASLDIELSAACAKPA